MKFLIAALSLFAATLWCAPAFAQQPPRFPIDQNKLAVGAKEKTPEELKQMMANGSKFMLIDVNPRAHFEKKTIPGAVNIPLE